jgi:hypothetical protein
MRKKKVKGCFGGNPDAGLLLSEKLNELKLSKGKLDEVLNKYTDLRNELSKNVTDANELATKYETTKAKRENNDASNEKNRINRYRINSTLFYNYFRLGSSIIGAIVSKIISIFRYCLSLCIKLIKTVTNIFNMGNGAIIRLVIFIIVFALIITFIVYGFINIFSNNNNKINEVSGNDITSELISIDNDDYLREPVIKNDIFSRISNWFISLFPNSYNNQFTAAKNSLNYMMTGKNQYDIYATKRDEITSGRSDNIFHFDGKSLLGSYHKDKTYSILKPIDVVFTYNSNINPNSDYKKLGGFADDYFKLSDTYNIPVKTNDNGKYVLDTDNANYTSLNNNNNIKKLLLHDYNNNGYYKFNYNPNKNYYNISNYIFKSKLNITNIKYNIDKDNTNNIIINNIYTSINSNSDPIKSINSINIKNNINEIYSPM